MRDVKDISELTGFLGRLSMMVNHPGRFPLSNLQKRPQYLRIIDFTCVFDGEFLVILKELARSVGENKFTFLTLSPDAVEFYHRHFGWLAATEFDEDSTEDDYVRFLLQDPGGSDGDAIAYVGECIAVLPENNSWVVYGTRGSGIAVIAMFGMHKIPDEVASPYFMSPAEACEFLRSLQSPVRRDEFVASWSG